MYLPSNFKTEETDWYQKIAGKFLEWLEKNPGKTNLKYDNLIRNILHKNKDLAKNEFPAKWKINLILWQYFNPVMGSSLGQRARKLLVKTKTRSLSGIVPLSVFTKGRGCPYHCLYCPTAKNEDIPKSYFPDEAAVQRAIRFEFDPYRQVKGRLLMFFLSGHNIDKVDLIIQGGTFSFYKKDYRRWFVKRCFDAANSSVIDLVTKNRNQPLAATDLETAQKENEKAKSRIIGITVETRPDYINKEELKFLRFLGVTRVEIGVQIVDDKILSLIKRGHTTKEIKKATYLLKEFGFKVTYHLMINLPGSNPRHDLNKLKEIFANPDYRPDNIKVYPTALVKGAELLDWYRQGKYKPYSQSKLIPILVEFKEKVVPEYVRIQRLVRDLTKNDQTRVLVESHLRQKLKQARVKCNCIRCREINNDKIQKRIYLKTFAYRASRGIEYFLSYVDKNNRLYGLLRLRILQPKEKEKTDWQAIIRELHVYGKALSLGAVENQASQHQGLGKKLINQAENLAKWHKVKDLAVISGIGVRPYYRKLNYRLKGTYMVKRLTSRS